MYNNIISGYTNGVYTFETLSALNTDQLVQAVQQTGLIRAMISEVISEKRYVNKFAQFKKKRTSSGKIVNRVYVNPTTGQAFEVNGLTRLFDLAPADVKAAITKFTKPLQYDVTYNKDEIRKAFTSEQALTDFLNMLIGSLYNGSEIDDKNEFLKLFKDLYNGNQAKIEVFAAVDKTNIEEFAIKLKTLVESFKEESSLYNVWKRLNPTDTSAVFWSNPEDINIILPIPISARMDIQFLAQLFNIERAKMDGRVFTVAADKLPTGVQAILFDSTLVSIDEIYAELEPTNYDGSVRRFKDIYNTDNEYGINPFANCVIVATSIPQIDVTTVRSKTVTVESGVSTVIPLNVTPIGANKAVVAVPSDVLDITSSAVTYSAENGYILTVTAVASGSVTFTGITGTITITVSA